MRQVYHTPEEKREAQRAYDSKRTHNYTRERKYSPRKPIALIFTKEGYKVCPSCEEELLLEEFPIRKGKHIGSCKECTRAADRMRNHLRRSRQVPIIPEVATKQCIECKITKQLAEFAYDPLSPDKRTTDCKACRSHYRLCPGCNNRKLLNDHFCKLPSGKIARYCNQCREERAEKQAHKIRENSRKHAQLRKSDPEYIEYHREKERTRYNTLPEAREKAKQGVKAYRVANPLKRREVNSRREARKKGNKIGSVSYKRILERDGYFCYICESAIDPSAPKKSPQSLVFDHVIPLVPRPNEPQGTHSEDNIRPVHHICNSRKKNKPIHLLTPFDRQGPI